MLFSILSFVIDTVFGLLGGLLLLRFWMQAIRVRPPTQVAQFTYQLTDWWVLRMRKIIPGVGGLDWASLLGAYGLACVAIAIKVLILVKFIPVTIFILALITVLQWVIFGLTGLLILEVIFSWVNPYAPLAPFVRSLNAPLLNPVRRVIPLLGGLDLSIMAVIFMLQLVSKLLSQFPIA